ncbi:hypothetical protein F1559_005122 [Cyanidiococcus yangmingshanensis]|uniref:Uncharacterized protein n=1 Tax=Cyanidiococcus yangmingshanensis TaxID=2690220 RepID=A0A7J7IR70_9RHOD|nr:hypothetical protein F1559_005122 [Cyanidiococcus yangmingshanensis]
MNTETLVTMRHGPPAQYRGYLIKKCRTFSTAKRWVVVAGSTVSNYRDRDMFEPSWRLNVLGAQLERIGKRKLKLVTKERTLDFTALSDDEAEKWYDAFKQAVERSFERDYELGSKLGEGAFAVVYNAYDKVTGEEVAVKVIRKASLDSADVALLSREMHILMTVQHPNCVATYDIYDAPDAIYIVMEKMKGGELFDRIAAAGAFSERDAAHVFRQLMRGVAYLHSRGIAHRDLKPENLLTTDRDVPPAKMHLKIADFGLANMIGKDTESLMRTCIGTPGYVAPEIVKHQPYTIKVDCWSAGVILFIMLSGKMPFYGKDDYEIMRRIVRAQYKFRDSEWAQVSDEAKSLVRSLLQVDPEQRLSAEGALRHPWCTSNTLSVASLSSTAGLRAMQEAKRNKMKAAVKAAADGTRMAQLAHELETMDVQQKA